MISHENTVKHTKFSDIRGRGGRQILLLGKAMVKCVHILIHRYNCELERRFCFIDVKSNLHAKVETFDKSVFVAPGVVQLMAVCVWVCMCVCGYVCVCLCVCAWKSC